MNYFIIAGLALLVIAPIVGWAFYYFHKKNSTKRLSQELEIKLFSIQLPRTDKKESGSVKEEIAKFEQLLSGLSSSGIPIVFETAVRHIGENIHFYVGAHRSVGDAVVKQIQGIWPDAQVQAVDDYNPFNPSGVSIGAYVAEKELFALPLKTYQEIEGDAFGPILNGLSKLDEIGEGAAIQVILKPAESHYKKAIGKNINLLKKGAALADILKTGLKPSFADIKDAFAPKQKEEKEKIIDETAIKALEMKMAKQLFKVNLRIVASGRTLMHADGILDGITFGFAQFGAPARNSLKVVKPRKTEELIYQYSFRHFDESAAMILNTEEIASLFHLPIFTTETPRIKWLKSKEAAPPSNLPLNGLLIGQNIFRGQKKPVFILEDDRRRHLYVVGQTGTGKSTLIYNMAAEDIRNGKGVAIIDPHGELIQSLLGAIPEERFEDVIIFDPGDIERPIGLNMLEYDFGKPEQKTFIVNEMVSILDRLYDLKTTGGPMFEQYMKNALLLLMEDASPSAGGEPATLVEMPRIFSDADYRERKLNRIQNPVVIDFWTKEAVKAGGEAALANMTPYVTSKFNNFIANDYIRPIIGQTKSAFNFREIMDSGKILLVNLSKGRIGDINASLLGMIITGRILMAALSRTDIPEQEKRRDFYLYIDEFQNFTTDSISTILSEARKYRLNLIMAHQFIAQLTEKIRDAVFGNVGSIVTFRVGSQDAEFLVKQFEPVFNQNDLINIDNLNAYVKLLINGSTSRPFNMEIPLNYVANPERVQQLKELSRLKHGKNRQEVEMEILKRLRE